MAFGWILSLILPHCPVMLTQAGGEMMGAVISGDKIEIVGGCRRKHSLERLPPGTADRAGRQTADCVGVVWGRRLQILFGQGAAEIFAPVDYRRIGLQLHAPAETIVKHRGNKRTFVCLAGFLLDYRSQGEYLVPGQRSVPWLQGAVHLKRTIDQTG